MKLLPKPFKYKIEKTGFYFARFIFAQTKEDYEDKFIINREFGTKNEMESFLIDRWGNKFAKKVLTEFTEGI